MPNEYTIYKRDETFYIRDLKGNRWSLQHRYGDRIPSDGSPIDPAEEILLENARSIVRKIPKGPSAPTYNRFSNTTNWSFAQRASRTVYGGVHGGANALFLQGSWAWRVPFGSKKTPTAHRVSHGYIPDRKHTEVMKAATMAEVNQELSATEYARNAWFFNPTKGHRDIRYEWCHLVAHGLGGPDHHTNIVAATKYQNSEQLILESVLHDYRMEGLELVVEAKLALGWQHLAESIWFRVRLGNKDIYSRTMDARRATKPDFNEYAAVSTEMRRYLNNGLRAHYPGGDLNMDEYEAFKQYTGAFVPEESTGLWQSAMKLYYGEGPDLIE
ncbi:hypothetical protein AB4Y44_36130 [Paraburkholderia sp. BR10937]|uniref:hypothetical protein n=1 Tax=Paraburkholderia sp. BR10937 TaxID=3236994 RepID=UPI0034D38769